MRTAGVMGGLSISTSGCLYVLIVCLMQHALSQLASECDQGGHRILRNPERSVDFDSTELQNRAVHKLICDHSLPPGWYRFMVDDRPAEMPASCVEMNRCGTQAPLWLSLDDGAWPLPGEVRQASACATWRFFHGSAKDCCLFRIPISVRSCGDFYLYHLQPTQGCMAYCAKVISELGAKLCPPDDVEINSTCQVRPPALNSKPVVTAELSGEKVHLRCSYSEVESGVPVGYLVTWMRHSAPGKKEEINRVSTLKMFVLLEMDGDHFKMGDKISCSVSTFLRNSTNIHSFSKESDVFYAGIKFIPDILSIAEDGTEHAVTIRSSVPVPCHGSKIRGLCGLTLHLSVDDSAHVVDGLGVGPANVVLSACQVDLRPMPCGIETCAQATLWLMAVTDFARDGNRASYVSAWPATDSPRGWGGYAPAPLKVVVQDIPTANCYSLTDPHIITFDGRRYDNHQTGTFVLYQSLGREFEVQARQWDCGSRHYAVACTCGVAAREGSSIVTFDMCNGPLQETRPRLSIKAAGAVMTEQIRILETHQGKKVTVMFPSGAFVRADVSDWGMNLVVRAPSMDFNQTRGLCGIFDRSSKNDLHGRDGTTISTSDLERFIQEWRISPGKSLFDTSPPMLEDKIKKNFCRCRSGYTMSLLLANSADVLLSPLSPDHCFSHDEVDRSFLFPSIDVTSQYIRSPGQGHTMPKPGAFHQSYRSTNQIVSVFKQGIKRNSWPVRSRQMETEQSPQQTEYQKFFLRSARSLQGTWTAGLDNKTDLSLGSRAESQRTEKRRKRRNQYEFQPIFTFQSLSHVNLEELAYFFPDDHLQAGRQVPHPIWPTPSGLTSSRALEMCQLALANSTVGTICRELLGRRLDEAVDLCLLDLQLKDDLAWEEALVPFLENECERRLLESRLHRAHEMAVSPGRVVTALRCPSFCSGNGVCTDWGCQCFPGYSYYDCSLTTDQHIELTDLENGGLCDVRSSLCHRVRIFGLGFINSPTLACHVTRLLYMNGAWVTGEQQGTRVTFLSSKAVDCEVPPLRGPVTDTADFAADEKPFARWELKVTNDGRQYSTAKVFTLYDELCQSCDPSPSGLCKLKEKTCNIDGMCYAEADISPTSVCLVCNPRSSKFAWSLNEANQPPIFHVPIRPLTTFVGESFVYQLSAVDPEGSAVRFLLESGPPGGSISPAGLLLWKAKKEEKQSFGFSASDECNGQAEFAVLVTVKPCECQNGGTCVTDLRFPPGSGEYLCMCPPGVIGHRCQDRASKCLSAPCGAGTCVDTHGGFRCNCPAGLQGATCDEDVNECEEAPCFPGATCTNSMGSYSCGSCPEGMLGNGHTCSDPGSSSGPTPEPSQQPQHIPTAAGSKMLRSSAPSKGSASPLHMRTSCTSRPCFPGVQCIDLRPPYTGYVCGRCPPGYHGNGRTCSKRQHPAPVRVESRLMEAQSSWADESHKVSWPLPLMQPSREAEEDLSLPAPISRPTKAGFPLPIPQKSNDVAVLQLRSPTSAASQDYALDDGTTEEGCMAHLCVLKPVFGQRSTSSPGISTRHWDAMRAEIPEARALKTSLASLSFTYPEPKFPADGTLDKDKSESVDPQGLNIGAVLVRGVQSLSFKAITPVHTNHTTVASTLLPKGPVTCADMPCFPGVACEPTTEGGFKCGRCPLGYVGDGLACRAVCRRPCGRNMECAFPNTCRCRLGYSGRVCRMAICMPGCKNGGRCIAPRVCECMPGYHGDTCEKALCTLPCEHGGTCVARDTCTCPYGFVGPQCKTMVCNRHCHNGGECESPDKCRCQPGWTGPSCETALCGPICLNGGTCLRPNVCVCPMGFYGSHCQNAMCSPSCKNGGRCVRSNVCRCPVGSSGGRCERSVCVPMCMNGGRCIGPDTCDCPSGWSGKWCDKPSCLRKCLNGGECIGPNACQCSPGWEGTLCQVPICQQKCLYGSRCVRPNICACRPGYSGAQCASKLSFRRG